MSSPFQNSITAEQYHCPLMFRHMPSVYSSGPLKPGGMTSGQRPGPSRFEKRTSTPFGVRFRLVICVVIGQFWSPTGELSTIALVSVSFWPGIGTTVPEPGVVGVVGAAAGVTKDQIAEKTLVWVGSSARARQ